MYKRKTKRPARSDKGIKRKTSRSIYEWAVPSNTTRDEFIATIRFVRSFK